MCKFLYRIAKRNQGYLYKCMIDTFLNSEKNGESRKKLGQRKICECVNKPLPHARGAPSPYQETIINFSLLIRRVAEWNEVGRFVSFFLFLYLRRMLRWLTFEGKSQQNPLRKMNTHALPRLTSMYAFQLYSSTHLR